MSQFTQAFDQLYDVQTEVLGVAVLATITGYCSAKPAIIGTNDGNPEYISGSTAVSGGYILQMKQSDVTGDLSASAAKGANVTCNGNATGETLQVLSADLANAIWIIQVGDIQSA